MSDKKKKTGLGLAIWLLAILIIFILFLVNKDVILTNLKSTSFFEQTIGTTPDFVKNHVPKEQPQEEELNEITIQIAEPKVEQKKEEIKQPEISKTEEKTKTQNEQKETSIPEKTETEKTEVTKSPEKPKQEEKKTVTYTELQLCFLQIDTDGSINRKMIKRSVPKNMSPLTTAINLLLQGPDTTKTEERNCISLIPQGTKLMSARVDDGIAYLSFSEDFEFNTLGAEGYMGQLMQIVYTASNFSTVKSVQFLVEGEKKDYLGSEGQWIGSPLSKNSFAY
ncbi:MAG: GerMN domain-containing protein [Treponema sp.]|nr:GerMN domain-containing protein [Treponema sp.]